MAYVMSINTVFIYNLQKKGHTLRVSHLHVALS